MSVCPLINIKASCGTVCLPDGCPLKAAIFPIMRPPSEFGKFTDPRDGRTYRTVKIGRQTWMAENLAFDYKGSVAYRKEYSNKNIYGLLYEWEMAKKAVPPGWHLPSDAEWDELVKFAGGSSTAGRKLKAASGWSGNGNGTDEYGFSALPGGIGYSDGSFDDVGYYGHWWSASEINSNRAYLRDMYYGDDYAYWSSNDKSYLQSVRCVQVRGGIKT